MERSNEGPVEDVLERFRREWHQEIASSQGRLPAVQEEPSSSDELAQAAPVIPAPPEVEKPNENREEQAASIYLQGVKCEQMGQVVEAIRFYKKAMQLVPDIEKRMYTHKIKEDALEDKEPAVIDQGSEESNEMIEKDCDDDSTDLLQKFQRHVQCERRICSYREEPKATHISALPHELVVYLLKWVISSDLDLRSLEQVALVCRGFYVCCRDAELWRLVCMRVWKADCGSPQHNGYGSWRDMYIERPRLQFNGCYISKTTYVRPGENSFQDANYRPWHLVTYFRYLRFFPEGLVLIITTADNPSVTVGHLRRRAGRHSSLMKGNFSLKGNTIKAVFRKTRKLAVDNAPRFRRRRDTNNNDGSTIIEQLFELELEIREHKKRKNWTLHWISYSIQTKYQNGEKTTTSYDMNPTRFPPFFYSRVRSYTAESENPLSLE